MTKDQVRISENVDLQNACTIALILCRKFENYQKKTLVVAQLQTFPDESHDYF